MSTLPSTKLSFDLCIFVILSVARGGSICTGGENLLATSIDRLKSFTTLPTLFSIIFCCIAWL
jgi:hypothetical protein